MYLNNRRGISIGNTVRGLSEMDYINNIQGDSDKVARAASAYQLYENMANLYNAVSRRLLYATTTSVTVYCK